MKETKKEKHKNQCIQPLPKQCQQTREEKWEKQFRNEIRCRALKVGVDPIVGCP